MSDPPPPPDQPEPPPQPFGSGEQGFTPSEPPPGMPAETQAQMNTMAIVAFVLSIVGLILFGIILGIAAVVLGAVSYQQINREPGRYRGGGLAIAAMIIGALDVVLAVVVISAIN